MFDSIINEYPFYNIQVGFCVDNEWLRYQYIWIFDEVEVELMDFIRCILELCATIFERRSVSADGITVYSASSHHQSYCCWEK
jgi:hypothetical protein